MGSKTDDGLVEGSSSHPSRPCNRCKTNPASLDLRGSERVCPACFAQFVANKTVKRLEVLQRETRGSGPKAPPLRAQRYLLALSLGPSSTALLHLLVQNLRMQAARGQRGRFGLLVVHVDARLGGGDDGAAAPEEQLRGYKERYSEVDFLRVPMGDVLGLVEVLDWSALPAVNEALPSREAQIIDLLSRLPSTTSRADLLRLFTRHLLVATAREEACDVVLMGYNTTSLAELTLSETAKGRGYGLPRLINDGAMSLPSRVAMTPAGSDQDSRATTMDPIPIYHPLREVMRNELLTFITITDPPLTELIPPAQLPGAAAAADKIVSHKDVSIDELMVRYFADVERNYPSVVTNVVRTTGKLAGPDGAAAAGEGGHCGLCGAALDEDGDERWRGELGEAVPGGESARDRGKLCYGCDRSMYG